VSAGEWFGACLLVTFLATQVTVWVLGARKHRRQQRADRERHAYWEGHREAELFNHNHCDGCSLAERINELEEWHELLDDTGQIEFPRWSEGWQAYVAQLRNSQPVVDQVTVAGQNGYPIPHREILSNHKVSHTIKNTTKFKKKPGPPTPPPPTSGAVTKRARRRT